MSINKNFSATNGNTEVIEIQSKGYGSAISDFSIQNEGQGTAIVKAKLEGANSFGLVGEVPGGAVAPIFALKGVLEIEITAQGGDVSGVIIG